MARAAAGLAVAVLLVAVPPATAQAPAGDSVTGDLFDHEYTIRRGDQTVATISKRWFSMRDTYAVDIASDQDDLLILASVLALDLAEDREREQH